jgi:hypothetical protein
MSALRKPIYPTPTPWSLSDQSGGLVPPRLKGRGLISQYATQQDYFGEDAIVAGILPKFTNLYAKRGISVNLPRLCEVGLPGRKAGPGFNTFKEPVAQQLRA